MHIRYLQLHITSDMVGVKVGTILRRNLKLSGTVLRRIKWLEDGILLDGQRVTVQKTVEAGQTLSVRLTDPDKAKQPIPAYGPLNILYEDEDIVVINKNPNTLVHPSHGHFNDSIGNYLMEYYHRTGEKAGFHPVHRLDKGTTGILVVAKHPYAQEKLKNQLHTQHFLRRYFAICEGCPEQGQGTINAPISQVDGSLVKREIRLNGQSAVTHYRVLHSTGCRTLLNLELETGRTHQIRVHMAYIGHPLIGDDLYGSKDSSLISRPALHSCHVELRHPVTGEQMIFDAPMPEDMKNLLFGG